MAVAYDTAVDAIELGGDGVLSLSITATGSDRAAFIGSAHSHSSASINGAVTFGGAATTELWDYQCDASAASDNKNRTAGYRYLAPPTSSTTVTNTLDSAPAYWQVMGCITLTGVDQTTPCGTPVTAEGASNTPSVTVTDAVSGDMVVDCLSTVYESSGVSETAGANQTSRCSERPDAQDCWGMSSQPGADGGVMSWTLGSSLSPYWGIGAVAFKQVATYQYAYPTTDTTRDNWEEDDGTTTTIYDQIDETSADDADYIRTQLSPTDDVYVTKFGSLTDPTSSTGHAVNIRHGKSATGQTINLTAQLRQGYTNEGSQGTLIATAMNAVALSTGWTQTDYTLSGGEADNITNYADLYLRLSANGSTAKITPVIETADATESGDNATTPTSPWAVSRPTLATGDMLILIIGWDDSNDNTGVTVANGPNSEVWTQINSVVASASTEVRMTGYYVVATGSWGSGSISVTPNTNEQWTASVLKIPAGEFDSTTPIGASATSASSATNETTVNSPALTCGGTDGDGRMIWACTVDADPQTSLNSGWTAITNTDRGNESLSVQSRDAAVTNSQSISAADGTRSIAGDSWCSLAFIVRAPAVNQQRAQVSWARLQTPSPSGTPVTANPVGVAGTGAAGTVTLSTGQTIIPAGVAGTGAAGTASAATDQVFAITGAAGTGAAGTVSVSISVDATGTPAGVAATGAAGTGFSFVTDQVFAISAAGATGAAGTVTATTPDVILTVNGVAATGAVNTVTIAADVIAAITGAPATGAAGTATATGGAAVTLTGATATGTAGTGFSFITDQIFPVAGVAGIGALGTVQAITPDTTTIISAAGATGAAGTVSLTTTATFTLTGVAGTAAAGTVTATATGDALATPAGVAATGAAGALSLTCDAAVSAVGASASGFAGAFTITGSATVAVTGASAIAAVGTLITTSELAGLILTVNALHSRTTCDRPEIEPPALAMTSRTTSTRPTVTVNG